MGEKRALASEYNPKIKPYVLIDPEKRIVRE